MFVSVVAVCANILVMYGVVVPVLIQIQFQLTLSTRLLASITPFSFEFLSNYVLCQVVMIWKQRQLYYMSYQQYLEQLVTGSITNLENDFVVSNFGDN